MRRLLITLLALALLLAPRLARADAGDGGGKAIARIKSAGVLKWGADVQGGEPYAYDDPKQPGHMVGFEVELADALAAELGVRAEMVQNDWSNLVPSLERGTFDVILNGLEITEGRIGRIIFSRPYYVFVERLMARASDKSVLATIDSLRGKRVGVLSNSLAFEMLRGKTEAVPYEGVEEPYIDLQQSRTDAVLLDDIIATRYGVPKKDLRVVGDLAEGYYALGIRRDEPELKVVLDAAIVKLAERGELQRIFARYNIWNERQTKLATWGAKEDAANQVESAPPPKFSAAHVVLFVRGAAVTLFVSALAMCIAVTLGLGLSLVRLFGPDWSRWLASTYVEVFRGTPVLLQLYLLYYGLAPVLKLGAISASVLGLGLNYAAYEAEVYRAGLQAVPPVQMEAALSLGMSRALALRRVILPQAIRHAVPNVTNDFIALLKDSSLVSVITVVELTKQMTITAVDVRSWMAPGIACAALYFAMSYPLSLVARRLELKLAGEAVPET